MNKKASSKLWLKRQMVDKYAQQAQKEGYRSRSVYKLIEMQKKFKMISEETAVLDLGCAPGGWCQFIAPIAKEVFAIDLKEIDPIQGVKFIKGDFVLEQEKILTLMNSKRFDVVLSDASPSSSGVHQTDSIRSAQLVSGAIELSLKTLNIGGTFIAKIIVGGQEKSIIDEAKQHFQKVLQFKPKASRKESSEMYLIALKFNTKESDLDPKLHSFSYLGNSYQC